MLTIPDTTKKFELKEDLLKTMTNKNYNIDLANSANAKLMVDFAKENYFDERAPCNKSTRDRSFIILPKTPGILVSISGVSSFYKK